MDGPGRTRSDVIRRVIATVAESASDALVAVDASGAIVYANPALARMFGRELHELVGSPIELLLPERHRDHVRRRLADLLARGNADAIGNVGELTGLYADGSEFPIDVSRGVRAGGDQPIVAGVLSNASERGRAEREIARLAACPDAVIGLAADGTIESWNPGAETLFGHGVTEVIGRSLSILAPPDAPVSPELVAAVGRGEKVRVETAALHRDGTLLTVGATIYPIRAPGGAVTGLSCVARDITERREEERELERRAQAADLDGQQAIISIDFDGRVHHWNEGARRIYGWSAEEAVGRNIDELTISTEELREGLPRLLVGALTHPREFRRRRKDGSFVDVLLRGAPWRVDGELVGVTSVALDITEHRERERERERRLARLERAQRVAKLGLWTWDPRVDVVTWSPEMFEIYGRDPAHGAASGAESLKYVHPDDRRRVAAALAHTFGGGVGWRHGHRIIDEHGNEKSVWVLGYADPEQPGCYYGTLQDVTELPKV